MVIRLVRDFLEQPAKKKLRRLLTKEAFMKTYYDEDVIMSESKGFYNLQMKDENWQNIFRVQARFCHNYKKVLDVGCGPYELVAIRNDESVIGIDVSKVALKKLKSYGFRGSVVQAEISHIPFHDLSFDCVISNQVIEHLLSKETLFCTINELRRLSKRIMIITPNAAYGRKIHDPTHFFFFTTRSLKKLLPDFKIYVASPPYEQTLKYYLQYDSPRLRRIPIIGNVIFGLLTKIDASTTSKWLNKKLWPGSNLVAVKRST